MPELVKDVVCGMMIEPATAAATTEYKGGTYYFCAAGCKQDFDANPEKYLSASTSTPEARPSKRWWEFWKT